MESSLLEELAAADAQGERALYTLWADDQILYRGEWHTIVLMQIVPPQRVAFTTDTGHHYIFDGLLLFPAMLSEKHFQAEAADQKVW